MYTAFSRDGPKKVYVQQKIEENAAEVNKLLEQKAYFYVCGDAASMAREVNQLLAKIIAKQRNISEQKGEEEVKRMRAATQYQEDVWS
jgi:NADPH-ferrihemoprotein reductase